MPEILPLAPPDPASPATPLPVSRPALANPPVATVIATPVPSGSAARTEPGADAILEKYRVAPTTMQQDVRKGCFLYFAAGLLLFALGVTVLYFAISSR